MGFRGILPSSFRYLGSQPSLFTFIFKADTRIMPAFLSHGGVIRIRNAIAVGRVAAAVQRRALAGKSPEK